MKDPLNNMKRNRLNKYGERKPNAIIAIEVAIKEPLVGGFIQSSAFKTKRRCVNQVKQLFDKQNRHKEATHSH